jgi:uncharacterized protein YjbJ (UPF0337 family)
MSDEEMTEKVKGTAKEAVGKTTGSDELAKEGEAQQKKAQKSQEADRLEQEAAQKKQQAAGHAGEEAKRQ